MRNKLCRIKNGVWGNPFSWLVVTSVLACTLVTSPSSAETFVVNELSVQEVGKHDIADFGDHLPGDGIAERAVGSGETTLRAAIEEANALPGHDTILLPSGASTKFYTELPALTDPDGVTITTTGSGRFNLDGSSSGVRLEGYAGLLSGNFMMLDLNMDGFLTYAEAQRIVFVAGMAVADLFQNLGGLRLLDFNELDLDGDGFLTDDELKHVNPTEAGFKISSPNNNIINIAITGSAGSGLELNGPTASNNTIQACYLGTLGTGDAGNDDHGILLMAGAHDNLIGGFTEEQRNVISGNGDTQVDVDMLSKSFGHGIMMTDAGTMNNVVVGNYIGVDETGAAKIANAFSGIEIRNGATANVIGGSEEGARNIIAGNGIDPDGCNMNCAYGFGFQYGHGILIDTSANNIIQGNWIGVSAAEAVLGNKAAGIFIYNSVNDVIGGPTPETGNVVSGQIVDVRWAVTGILVEQSVGTRIESNIVGLLPDGSTPATNFYGIEIFGSLDITIGSPGAGNVISSNVRGMEIDSSPGSIVQGNFIGTDVTGTSARPNDDSGLLISGSYFNGGQVLVGGSGPGERNVLSGNFDDGIVIYGLSSNTTIPAIVIQGNYIGVDVTGNVALPNSVIGILIDAGSRYVQVGGTAAGEGNVISGNGLDGIRIARSVFGTNTSHITVQGNNIGVGANGTTRLGNALNGITILEGAVDNTIGGIGDGEANIIANNSDKGVRIKGGSENVTNHNTIRGNSIFSNTSKGIVLEVGFGESANDNIPKPIIDAIGPVAGKAVPNATIDIYADAVDEGRFYLGTGPADGAGNFSFALDLSDVASLGVNKLTATATDALGNTSEFSEPFLVAPPTIDTEPSSIVVVEGDAFSLTTAASGSAPLDYQWEFLPEDGEFEDVVDDAAFSGATTATLSSSGARISDEGSYRCSVTNVVGSATTVVVTVTVIPANTDTAVISTLLDNNDANTQSPAHLIADPGIDGLISLREAMIASNNRAGADTITFNVSGTIQLSGGLPTLNDLAGGTTIDGGGVITLDGGNLGGSITGIQITSAENVLTGLTIVGFPGNGVHITGVNAAANTVIGCMIGTNGVAEMANGGHGVLIQNGATDTVIGGVEEASRNVISGNVRSGVYIGGATTTNNFVNGNFIGLAASGAAALANGESGVTLINGANGNFVGGELEGEGNVVSANTDSGITISGVGTSNNIVAGNQIGLNAEADDTLGNVEHGVALFDGATDNVIGGGEAAANWISGNAGAGVLVDGAATLGNSIRFNNITGNFSNGISLSNDGNANLAAPVITGLGSVDGTAEPESTVDIYASTDQQGSIYLATTTADVNGDFSSPVALEPVVGMYVTATSTDADGNTSAFSDGFFVDLEPPVLTLLGEAEVSIQCGAVYTDAGATALDDVDGNITGRIVRTIRFGGDVVAAVDTSVLGTYTITYEVSDNAGQEATPVGRTVEVIDTTAPVITLNGAASLVVECSSAYTDAGAVANDSCDGAVDVTLFGTVDTSTPGVYALVYRATDSQGNNAAEVTRTVTVSDTTSPVITVLGNLQLTLECGTAYLDAGATATDSCDTTVEVTSDNPVLPGVPGVYTILYNATDSSGNVASQAFRTVTVVDTTAPVITLLGGADITVECGLPYNEPGAVVDDVCDGELDFIVTGQVNTSAPGNYTLAYSASDSSGNVAVTVTRVVRVADNALPVIVLNGPSTLNVECGGTYTESGATASDNCEGDLTESIVISGSVNTTVAGTYTINYDVADSVGNQAARVSRTVVVAVCPAPCEDQCANDPDNAIDEDGDGLSACIEACLGTDDTLIDSDGDGVPDGTEVETGTDPIVPDSDLDLDGDGLTQLEEFIFDSDPLDPNSPAVSFFVSPNGADSTGGGDPFQPWASISFALAQSNPSANNPVRIILADGNYPEDVQLLPWVTLVGSVGNLPRIEGTVFGADNSGMVNVEIAAFTSDDVMLVLDNAAMMLENVVFRGSAARPAAGILADGARTSATTIDGCLFTSLSIGIDVGGALPMIRRCTFEDTTIAGVFVRGTASIGGRASLGDVDDPSTGSNLFSGITQGRAVINELAAPLLAQQNDWGTTDVATIQSNLLTGNVIVDPVLTPGSAANTASLYVTVWRAENQARIANATVKAATGTGASVTVLNDRNGVYSLPILRAGSYSVEVSAFGFETQTITVNLEPGQLGSRIVALQLAEVKGGGPSCYGGPAGSGSFGMSDFLITLLLLGGLLVGVRKPLSRTRQS